jgi:hypothetical protein
MAPEDKKNTGESPGTRRKPKYQRSPRKSSDNNKDNSKQSRSRSGSRRSGGGQRKSNDQRQKPDKRRQSSGKKQHSGRQSGGRSRSSEGRKRRPDDKRRQQPRSQQGSAGSPPRQSTPGAKPDPTYAKADLLCDFAIKGSLASAIVHSSAACELAKKYRFATIGGSGVGSAAAAMIAAAEAGRKNGAAGFGKLNGLLDELGEKGRSRRLKLFDLVNPDEKTAKYFELCRETMAGLKPNELELPLLSVLKAFPGLMALGALPGVLLAITAFFAGSLWLTALWLVAGIIVAGLVPTVIARQRVIKEMNRVVTENEYGFCSGMSTHGGADSMGQWLHESLNALAGKQGDEPLLFGELQRQDDGEKAKIDLQLQCTDISINRPIRFPDNDGGSYQADQVYYFKPGELKRYLPEAVVDSLVKHSRKQGQFKKLKGYYALPVADELPVAFAVRCSMSVPVLFSAVPLYRAVRLGGRGRARWEARSSWIVGGELSGTFDVDAFDAPLPHHPTFAIHVSPIGSDDESKKEQLKGIWVQNLITHNGPTLWREFNDIRGFMRACFYTAKNWHEGVLMETPGYRERIAIAKISQQQTGLFPAIDKEAYAHLMSLGSSIGNNLISRFAEESSRKFAVSWEAHRWIRFRRQMANLEQLLFNYKDRFHNIGDGDRPYEALMLRGKDEAPHAFRWKDIAQRNHALRVTTQLLNLIESWQKSSSSFIDKQAPYDESDNYTEQLR